VKKLSLVLIATLTFASLACGDDDDGGGSGVCKKAIDVLNDCDGVDAMIDENAACTGAAAAWSQCIVDHPDAVCDPQASDRDEYDQCAEDALGQ
jgi:hypothetical protein